jgi:hypothetical protein
MDGAAASIVYDFVILFGANVDDRMRRDKPASPDLLPVPPIDDPATTADAAAEPAGPAVDDGQAESPLKPPKEGWPILLAPPLLVELGGNSPDLMSNFTKWLNDKGRWNPIVCMIGAINAG